MLALTLLFSFNTLSNDCPIIEGSFRAKVGENLTNLKIESNNCRQYSFQYEYESGYEVDFVLEADDQLRTYFDDGRIILKQKAKIVDVLLAGKYQIKALKVTKEEYIRNHGLQSVSESLFYGSGNQHVKTLVERRDNFNSNREKIGTIYIGYVSN